MTIRVWGEGEQADVGWPRPRQSKEGGSGGSGRGRAFKSRLQLALNAITVLRRPATCK